MMIFKRKADHNAEYSRDRVFVQLTLDRTVIAKQVRNNWRGRTFIHREHGVFIAPDVEPGSVTDQIIRLATDLVCDALEAKGLDLGHKDEFRAYLDRVKTSQTKAS
jgi:hypothetical protein